MVGDVLLILLGVMLLILLVLLLLPVSVRASYENGVFGVWLRYASKTITLYPRMEKEQPQDQQATEPNQKKEKQKPNWEQISYSLDVLPKVVLRALRRTGRRIRIEPLKLHILVAGSDPADTAVLYGRLHGVFAAVLPPLHRAVRISDQDIQLFPDFCEERMDFIADAGIRIRPWDALVVAVFAAGGLLRWFIGFRKRADRPAAALKHEQNKTAPADPAA